MREPVMFEMRRWRADLISLYRDVEQLDAQLDVLVSLLTEAGKEVDPREEAILTMMRASVNAMNWHIKSRVSPGHLKL